MSYKVIGVVLVLFATLTLLISGALFMKKAGRNEERAEQAEQVRKRLNNATIADDAATRCLADPTCRLSDDGYKRE